jgi:pantetheine-phosphate adenylyltransferase
MQMAGLNGAMAAVETVFFAASPETRHIAASFVRQIAVMGGDASQFVPASVQAKLRSKFPQTP